MCRAVASLRAVGALLNALDRLAFLQAVSHAEATTLALQADALALVPRMLLAAQPRAVPLLGRVCRLLSLALRLFRERALTRLTGAGATNPDEIAAAHELAFHVAMAHEARPQFVCGRCGCAAHSCGTPRTRKLLQASQCLFRCLSLCAINCG